MKRIFAYLLVAFAFSLLSACIFSQEITKMTISPDNNSTVFGGRTVNIAVDVEVSAGKLEKVAVDADSSVCESKPKTGLVYGFVCRKRIPTGAPSVDIIINANATWNIGNQPVTRTSTTILTLNVTNRLYPELVYPEPVAATGIEEDKKHVKVRLMFPEGDKQYDLATVVPADINGEKVNFVWDDGEKVFVAEYDLERLEKGKRLQMKISLLGDVSGEKTFYPTIAAEGVFGEREKFPVEAVAGMVGIGAVAVVIAVWFFAFRKKRAESRGELEVKRERLMKLMKLEEIDFYKRRITEDEFKKRRFERQEELNEVNAKLEALGGKAKAGALEQKTA